MSEHKTLKVVVQATVMYVLANALFVAVTTMARYLTINLPDSPTVRGMKYILMEGVVHAGLLIFAAWLLLAKANWFSKAIADMSRPRQEEAIDE